MKTLKGINEGIKPTEAVLIQYDPEPPAGSQWAIVLSTSVDKGIYKN